ncbi:MAG TPA: hypothetical protein ENO08_00040, partial [Candidatus Eisenbacteria bacterium]|nr:hypothetical protein [Candidatus Eisenbacteria bacterium]
MNRAMRTPLLACLIAAAVALPAAEAHAQYPFGKNKIQYTAKDWKVMETEHVDIFYYPDEEVLAGFVAGFVEGVYDEYSAYFRVDFESRIPVILYGTHHDFKETNVIPYILSEATLGFTEFIKGRVALPFTGSYYDLERVCRHELVHAFMLEKLRVVMQSHRRYTYQHPPLWFTEGLAEFLGKREQDNEAHMFLRDAVTGNRLVSLPEMWRIDGSFLMYKEGESALHYLATRFGRESIVVLLENWWKSDRFDILLRKTIGIGQAELSEDWEEYLRRRYFPAVLTRRRADEAGTMLSEPERSFDSHPAVLLDDEGHERYFCLGFGLGTIDLKELRLRERGRRRGEGKSRTIIRGGGSTAFESIPILRSHVSGRGDTLLFVAKTGERDAIYLYDPFERKTIERIEVPDARMLNSPSLSRDGRSVAFSAIDDHGRTDLYVYDRPSGRTRRLTDDVYDDLHPDWHPDGRSLVFCSDRCDGGMRGSSALFTIEVETGRIEQITDGSYRDTDPRWLDDGRGMLFSSDRTGVADIWLLEDGVLSRQTGTIGGLFNPVPCPDGAHFLASGFSGGSYRIYQMAFAETARESKRNEPGICGIGWTPVLADSSIERGRRDYRAQFGVDFIGAAFAVDPDYGYMGNGAQIYMTDILGDHQLMFLFGSASDDFDDFWTRLNVAATYYNQSDRLNWAVGAFHLASYMGTFYDLLRFERRYGVVAAVSYPVSKFTRIELSGVFKGMERDDDITFLGLENGKSWLVSSFLSLTTDNIVWYVGGPLKGHRMNVALGNTIDLEGRGYESTTLNVDLRNYQNIGRRIVFAQRFVSRSAWGSDLQLFYLGGSWDLRGYEFRDFAGKKTMLFNNEIRFPLLDRLLVRLPFGHIDFPLFRGALFFDTGRAWDWIEDTGWIGSVGAGVEMNLGYLPVIRLNFSRRTDFREIEKKYRIGFF